MGYNTDELIRVWCQGQAIARDAADSARRCRATSPGFAARTPYDPALARALLDRFGYKDRDGDGFRELPDGKPLALTHGHRRRRRATASATSCGRRT